MLHRQPLERPPELKAQQLKDFSSQVQPKVQPKQLRFEGASLAIAKCRLTRVVVQILNQTDGDLEIESSEIEFYYDMRRMKCQRPIEHDTKMLLKNYEMQLNVQTMLPVDMNKVLAGRKYVCLKWDYGSQL